MPRFKLSLQPRRPLSSCRPPPTPWSWLRFVALVAALAGIAPTAFATASPDARVTGGIETARSIAGVAQVLEDSGGLLRLDDVRGRADGWTAVAGDDALAFGFSRSTWWIRWSLVNADTVPVERIVDLGTPHADFVDWHVVRLHGTRETVDSRATGDRRTRRDRPVAAARNIAFPVVLGAGERVEVYLRVASHDGFFEPIAIRISDPLSYRHELDRDGLLINLYHGGLLALAIYNLLLFAGSRERSVGLYVVYVLSVLCYSVALSGYGDLYLWPDAVDGNNALLPASVGVAFGVFGLFAIDYLQLRTSVPGAVFGAIRALSWLNLAAVAPAAAGHYAVGVAMVQALGLCLGAACVGVGLLLLWRGQRQARYFVGAFTLLGIGVVVDMMRMHGVLPASGVTGWALEIGSALEALVLALGIADRMNRLKVKRIDAERQANDAQLALSNELGQRVEERTRALAAANERLQALAVTDELTGAFNRRHFNTYCELLLARDTRSEPVALCIFDIDRFKRYNDRHGHPAGDAVLRRVAATVQAMLQRSGDALFRLGGEEFGVLFSARSPGSAHAFADEMRRAIAGIGIVHEGNETGVVTASFGVCWIDRDGSLPSPTRLYRLADEQLYAAKDAGRNQVCLTTEAVEAMPTAEQAESIATRTPAPMQAAAPDAVS